MKPCSDIEDLLTAYVDQELDENHVKEVQEHLAVCRHCTEKLEAEKRVKSWLKDGYRIEPTPVHLRARIRRLIYEGKKIPGFFELIKEAFTFHKVKGALALLALLFFITYPYIRMGLLDHRPAGFYVQKSSKLEPIELVGEVLCVDCEILNLTIKDHQHEDDHRLGLKAPDGRIWQFLPVGEGRKLLHDEKLIRKKIKIEGYTFPDGMYVTVEHFQQI